MTYHYFIKGKEHAVNPAHQMVFSEIVVRSIISVGWVSTNNLRCAVAFTSKEQAIKYMYSYIKPFVSTEDFKQLDVIEICTEYVDVKECLLEL